jgi:hypothetical protein
MGYKKTTLQVTTGSGTSVHIMKDDGSLVLAAGGDNRVVEISASVEFDGGTNQNALTGQGAIVSGMFRIPLYESSSEGDISILNTLAGTPSNYNGYVFYMNSSKGLTKGAIANGGSVAVSNDAAQYFAKGATMYYCRNGNWFTDNLVTVPRTFTRQLYTLFNAGDTDWDIHATSAPTFGGSELEFSSSMGETGQGWGTTDVAEPTWTYNTHKRIEANWVAGNTDYNIPSTTSVTWAGGDLEFSSAMGESGQGYGATDPAEPTWTYGSHKRIGPISFNAGDTDWDIHATSAPTFGGSELEFSASMGETGHGWGTTDIAEPTWTYNTHKRIEANWVAGNTDYNIPSATSVTWSGGDLEFSSSIGETAAGWDNS